MHFNHFSKDLMSIHVWRQTQTQSTIDNFYQEDMNIFNPRRNDRGDTQGFFRMEFPLMQWMVACVYKVYGKHIIISRLFMFFIGIFSVLGIYKLLMAMFVNETLAVFGAWAFNFSPCFYYYTINPLPDNLALCSAIWGLALFFSWHSNKKGYVLFLAGLFFSVAALCKLPFIIYYVVPLLFFLKEFNNNGITKKITIQFFSVFSLSLLPIIWYATVIPQWEGNMIIKGVVDNEESVSMLLYYLQHTLISTLPELLLNYGSLLFFLAGFYFICRRKAFNDPRFALMFSLGLITLFYYFYEVNAIATIHDYYLFPFLPLIFILVSYGAFHLYKSGHFYRYLTISLLMLLPLFCFLRMQGRWNPEAPGFNKDLLIYKSELQKAVPEDALVVAGNDVSRFILFYYINKKGWSFTDDKLTAFQLTSMMEKGAEYLYTDSEKIQNDSGIKKCVDEMIIQKGSVMVFKLKKIK